MEVDFNPYKRVISGFSTSPGRIGSKGCLCQKVYHLLRECHRDVWHHINAKIRRAWDPLINLEI